MNPKGQLSLEYLMIFTAGIALIVFLFPVFTNLYNSAIFALDVKAAESFGYEFQNSVAKLNAFETGSTETISIDILTTWKFSTKENELLIDVSNKKELSFPLKAHIDLSSKEFENSVKFELKKEKDMISVNSI